MNADATQDGSGLAADRLLPRSAAVSRVCLQGRRRLSVATMLAAAAFAAAALAAGAVAVSLWQSAPQEVTLELNEADAFSSLPSFIAELKQGKARVHVLQLALAVEMPASQQWRLEGQQSAVEEAIKTRLRHFDRRELEENAGADRLRDEVLAIVNDAIAPAAASRVLFRQFVLD
jgi:flagellar basal body-associated protein FliL